MTRPDAVDEYLAREAAERDRRIRRANLVTRARDDSAAGSRETIRLLTIIVALGPYTEATTAAPGRLGAPIEATPPHLQGSIPRQRHRRR